jgi:Cellulase (glycosyl hydrolase family 5)/Carboxypeptidase regulatory-like domain
MKRQWFILILLMLGLSLVAGLVPAAAQSSGGVPDSRWARLARGVNLPFAFWCDASCYNPTRFDNDLPTIAASGFTNVRLVMTFSYIENGSGGVNTTVANDLKRFLDRARANNLAVIIDVHDTGIKDCATCDWSTDYMRGIRDANFRPRHINFWRAFATWIHQNTDPEWVFIQPANEPIFTDNPSIWYNHQNQLFPVIRAAAPNHTIFVIPHEWQSMEALVWSMQTPFADRNVVYDLHWYEPMGFTHQCQGWAGTADDCNNVYPGNYPLWDGRIVYYDRAYMETAIRLAYDWARQYNARIFFSEFGVGYGAPSDSRARYLRDVISIFRQYGFGYAVYEWRDNFGIAQDAAVLSAVMQAGGGGGAVSTPAPTVAGATSTPRPAATNTPMPNATATRVPPTATPAPVVTIQPGTGTFFRAINLGGNAVTVDNNLWEAQAGAPNFSVQNAPVCNPWVNLNPATDATRTDMIRCAVENWSHNIVMSNVPNGTYGVYFYLWSDWTNPSPMAGNFFVEGQSVMSYTPGVAGTWSRMGPYAVNIADGTINITSNGGSIKLSGIEVWRTSGAAASATPLPTNTPIVPTATVVQPTATVVAPTSTLPPPTATAGAPEARLRLSAAATDVAVGTPIALNVGLEFPELLAGGGAKALELVCMPSAAGIVSGQSITVGTLFDPSPIVVNPGFRPDGSALVAIARSGGNAPVNVAGNVVTLNITALAAGEVTFNCTATVIDGTTTQVNLPVIGATIRVAAPVATNVPPTATLPPTATNPAATAVPPTATLPPTATPLPTNTMVPPTATPVPPTATFMPTATIPPTATLQPTPGTRLLTGIVLRSHAAENGITIEITDANGAVVASMTTDAQGGFQFVDLPPGVYTITARTEGYLSAQGAVIVPDNASAQLPPVTLLAGDVLAGAPMVVDELDVVQLAVYYGSAVPQAPVSADLNMDGRVGLADLQALAENIRKTGPIAWQ